MNIYMANGFMPLQPMGAGLIVEIAAAAVLAVLVGWNMHRIIDAFVTYKSHQLGKEPPEGILTVFGTVMKHPVLQQRVVFTCVSLFFFILSALFFPVWEAVFLMLFTVGAMIGSSMDNRIHIIPNELMLGMFVLSLLYRLVSGGWKDMLFAFLSCLVSGIIFLLALGLFLLFTRKMGMHAGDLKLLMVMGAACGYTTAFGFKCYTFALLAMSAAVIVYVLYGLTTKFIQLKSYFPFCFFGMIGIMAGLFYPVYGQYL